MPHHFRKIIRWIHLWLGLSSGLVVLILGLTGCVLSFEQEIRGITEPWQSVEAKDQPMLPPSALMHHAAPSAGNLPPSFIQYRGTQKSVVLLYKDPKQGFRELYINPYTGSILKIKWQQSDFFRLVLEGHFYLWLPHKVGQPLVATSVLLFVILLITGLFLWWPKKWNKAALRNSFRINRRASFKRLNYDLHKVPGFYGLFIGLALSITGLCWGFSWVQQGIYWLSSGGKPLQVLKVPVSTIKSTGPIPEPADQIWQKMCAAYDLNNGRLRIQWPQNKAAPYSCSYNPDQDVYYRRQFRYFDQYSLVELKAEGLWARHYETGSMADKLHRLNYDIHVGAVWGFAGKLLAFFGSLLAASLPVSGLLIWKGRRWKK
jgi:uncharacterized iron-regulated membrane protein